MLGYSNYVREENAQLEPVYTQKETAGDYKTVLVEKDGTTVSYYDASTGITTIQKEFKDGIVAETKVVSEDAERIDLTSVEVVEILSEESK